MLGSGTETFDTPTKRGTGGGGDEGGGDCAGTKWVEDKTLKKNKGGG